MQLERRAASRARASAGKSIAANIPIMAITASNSINVKPDLFISLLPSKHIKNYANIPMILTLEPQEFILVSRSAVDI